MYKKLCLALLTFCGQSYGIEYISQTEAPAGTLELSKYAKQSWHQNITFGYRLITQADKSWYLWNERQIQAFKGAILAIRAIISATTDDVLGAAEATWGFRYDTWKSDPESIRHMLARARTALWVAGLQLANLFNMQPAWLEPLKNALEETHNALQTQPQSPAPTPATPIAKVSQKRRPKIPAGQKFITDFLKKRSRGDEDLSPDAKRRRTQDDEI